jgi:hypothetical protein
MATNHYSRHCKAIMMQTVRNIAMLALIVWDSSLPKTVVRATKSQFVCYAHSTPPWQLFLSLDTHTHTTNHNCKMLDFF